MGEDKIGTMQRGLDQMVKHIRRGRDLSPHIALGPVVQSPEKDGPKWHFVIATGDAKGCRFDQMGAPNKPLAEDCRMGLALCLVQTKPPVVLHDFADELAMIRLCETLWPSARVRKIKASIEAERSAA